MTQKLAHRGPDDQGFYGQGANGKEREWKTVGGGAMPITVGLGSRRLSILDVSSNGAMPMRTRDGRYTIVFNGQIYNFIELRRQLGEERFRSKSDTEVLLELFARDGVACLDKLDGMFAFCIWDRQERCAWIARDPLGIKPLYYRRDSRGLFFASEIRALRAASDGKLSPKVSLLSRHFISGWLSDPDTLLEGIDKLEPGHWLRVDLKSDFHVEKHRYWDLELRPETGLSSRQWADRLDAALDTAMKRQLRSDVPVGFFLSGGVDSSLLAARAAREPGVRPVTFTTGFRWPGTNEEDPDLRAARTVARRLGFEHHEVVVEPSVATLLPRVIDALEEPIGDPAAICSYLLCEAAKSRFKVLISGQGSDELFGGYPVYQAGAVASAIGAAPPMSRLLRRAAAELPYSVAGRPLSWTHRLRKVAGAATGDWSDTFAWIRSSFRREQLGALFSPDAAAAQEDPLARHRAFGLDAGNGEILQRLMYLDAKTYLPSNNLAYSDKTSMAHSVELRVPFLDREVIEVARHMPPSAKLDWWRGKIVVKAVARRYLPAKIVHRKKAGFGLPIRQWFRRELQPMARDLLSESRLRRQGWIAPELPSRWLDEHRDLEADHGMKLFSLLSFQLWIDGLR